MNEHSLNQHLSNVHLKNRRWFRQTAFLLSVILALTAVMASTVYVSADLSDFTDDPDAAAGTHLLENNNYIAQNWLQRAGIVAAAALTAPKSFEDYYRLAEISISRSDFSTALKHIESCLTLTDPADIATQANVWLVKGSLETLLDEDDAALASLAEAARLDPKLGDAYLVRTQIFIQREQWRRAIEALDFYFDRSPTINTRMYAAMGELQMMLGNYQAAADQYSLSIQEYNAVDPDLYLRRGGCYAQLGAYAEAAADFSRAADLGADRALCVENIVLCYLVLQDYAAVLDSGAKLAAEALASAELLQNMGVAAMALERMEEAEAYFDQSIILDGDLAASYYYRGICRLSLEQYEEACVDFTMSIDRGEALQLSYYNRGVCYLHREQYDEAQADMEWTVLTGGDPMLIKSARAILQQLDGS
jgi:tetratricopeptide (TPR) repeat protein